jgi:RHS repeat-associated protein
MAWDFKNQLASTQAQVVTGGAKTETTYYLYDSGGQRARKLIANGSGHMRADRIYLGGGFEIYREYKGGGQSATLESTTLHVMDDQRRVAVVESRAEVTTVRYQLDNHLGSACLELDDAAAVISYEEYYPYGSTSYQSSRSTAEVSLKRYRFTGKERDAETGFYYHGARYYAPWLGRWTSADPSGIQDGPNVFAYVNNNPVEKTDPTGNWDISWKHVAIGALTAVVVIGAVALTAGAAAPLIAAGLAEAGVSAGTISALGTAAVATGTVVGVAGTVDTANEIASGRTITGRTLTDEERSERVGALPVQVLGTFLGIRGISASGGGGGGSLGELAPAVAQGLAEENTFGPFLRPLISPGVSIPTLTAAPSTVGGLTGVGLTPGVLAMMNNGGGDDNASNSGTRSGSESNAGATSSPEPPPTSEDIGRRINSLPEDQQNRLLARVVRGDQKGRPFGTPRNPRLPTVEEFNARIEEVRAGDLEELVTGTRHGIYPEQAQSIRGMSAEELVRFRTEDPISATRGENGLSLTGGHHRTAEIVTRVNEGTLDPNTIVRILVHD